MTGMARPGGLRIELLLAFLAVAGPLYIDIMPVYVAGLRQGLGFTPQQAGLVASLNSYGATLGALLAIPAVTRLPWRRLAAGSALGLIAADLGSASLTGFPALCLLRGAHGVAAGLLVGLAYALMARSAAPDRAFGWLFVVHFALGGLGVMLGTALMGWSYRGIFLVLAVCSALALAMVPLLPDFPAPPPRSPEAAPAIPGRVRLLALALLGLFLFQTSNIGIGAFLIGIGQEQGHDLALLGGLIGLGLWLGAAGPLAILPLARRLGRAGMVLLVLLLAAASKALLLAGEGRTLMISLAVPGLFLIMGAGLSALFALCAGFDRSGRAAAMAGFASKLGLSVGPLLGGVLLPLGWPVLVLAGTVVMLLAALCCLAPARALALPPPAGRLAEDRLGGAA